MRFQEIARFDDEPLVVARFVTWITVLGYVLIGLSLIALCFVLGLWIGMRIKQ